MRYPKHTFLYISLCIYIKCCTYYEMLYLTLVHQYTFCTFTYCIENQCTDLPTVDTLIRLFVFNFSDIHCCSYSLYVVGCVGVLGLSIARVIQVNKSQDTVTRLNLLITRIFLIFKMIPRQCILSVYMALVFDQSYLYIYCFTYMLHICILYLYTQYTFTI